MYYGICLLSVIPCRRESSNSSEMVTQLLFGEHYSVKEQNETWVQIITAYDNYECWISRKQHTKISESLFKSLELQSPVLSAEFLHNITNKNTEASFPIPIGSTLPAFVNKECKLEEFVFNFEGKTVATYIKKTPEDIIATSKLFLNAPYLWGGRTFMGIDCSGFTQLVYKLNGYKLPRDAYQQAELGHPLNFVEEAQPGDLAFFDNEEGKIVHVGILLSGSEIIHASGSVRIDKFDHYGIFHSENKKYSHMLRVIKRI
jgi:gamma-D-glutamyl-L-lysine dipeptidyl-peptidase